MTEQISQAENVLADPRVVPDSFLIYPTNYELIPYADRDNWVLTVQNGHSWGWKISPGLGVGGSVALDRDGNRVIESRAHPENQQRRWPLEEALAIALDIVDTKHAVMGTTAQQAIENRETIIASFGEPS